METEKNIFLLKQLSELTEIPLLVLENGEIIFISEGGENFPLYRAEELRELLKARADRQEQPCLYYDKLGIYFVCIRVINKYILAGPMRTDPLTRTESFEYMRLYHLKGQKLLPKEVTFQKILEFTGFLSGMLLGQPVEEQELITANHLIPDEKTRTEELVVRELTEEMEEIYHHSYMEERKLLACVEDGREEEAVELSCRMDSSVGTLSNNKRNNQRYQAITEIALCTRAAISGGLAPSVAYRLSDYFIMKLDMARETAQILLYRDQAVRELAKRVRMKKENSHVTSYVEQCKDYVSKNFRKKIYIDEIAEKLGISTSYLSHLFRKETGKTLEEYIIEVRLEKARNLLMYSNESLANIAAYVGFPSQSYFGEKFKKYFNMTPMQYRRRNKPAEFDG